MSDLVSVVVTNHNHGRYLRACLDAALGQDYQPLEVIVVDDGSTDESPEVLREYENRVRVIEQENRGQAAALAEGFRASEGAYVALLDADDGWYPDKVSRSVHALRQRPEAGWLRHRLDVVDEQLRPLAASVPPIRRSAPLHPDLRLVMERVVTALTSAIVVRRPALEAILPLPATERFRYDADFLILARLVAEATPGYSLDRALGFYRRHPGQLFTQKEDIPRMIARQVEVAANVAHVLDMTDRSASSAKHRVVLAAVTGSPPWATARLGPVATGIAATVRLWDRPALAARQLAGLLFAFLAPRRWLRRLRASAFLATEIPSGEDR